MKAFMRNLLEPIRRSGAFDVPNAMRKGRVISRTVAGVDVNWLITNSNDEIQSKQLAHGFYELVELEQLRADVGPRRSVFDIGANIGNHTVYFIALLGCQRLIGIEPFASAYQHLLVNLALNQRPNVDLRLVNVALGRDAATASILPPSPFNIGLTKVDVGHGDVPVIRGDELIREFPVDLIKIDVEGMEMSVLAGLTNVMKTQRPAIYVETTEESRSAVLELTASYGYTVIRETPAYDVQSNLTLIVR